MSYGLAFVLKVVLLLLNLIMMGCGAACLVLGVTLLAMKSEAVRLLNLLDSMVGGPSRKVEIDAATSYASLVSIAGYMFSGLGGCILLVCACGCCGACTDSRGLLYFYTFMLSMALMAQIGLAVGMKLFWSTVTKELQNMLFTLQNKYYIPLSAYMKQRNFKSRKIAVSYLINSMQISLECCGAKRVGDVANSTSWTSSNNNIWDGKPLVRPITCCKLQDAKEKDNILKPEFDLQNLHSFLLDPQCPFSETADNSGIHNQTCSKALMNYLTKYSTWGIILFGGIACAEISSVVFSCCLACSDDDDYDDYDD